MGIQRISEFFCKTCNRSNPLSSLGYSEKLDSFGCAECNTSLEASKDELMSENDVVIAKD